MAFFEEGAVEIKGLEKWDVKVGPIQKRINDYKNKCLKREDAIRAKSCECSMKERQRMMAGLSYRDNMGCNCIVNPKRPILFTFLLWVGMVQENYRQREMAGLHKNKYAFYASFTMSEIRFKLNQLGNDLWKWWGEIIHPPYKEIPDAALALPAAEFQEKIKQYQRTLAGITPVEVSPELKTKIEEVRKLLNVFPHF